MTVTAAPAAIVFEPLSEQSTVASVSREQKPTAVAPTVTVPPAQFARLAPAGKVRWMRALAPESAENVANFTV